MNSSNPILAIVVTIVLIFINGAMASAEIAMVELDDTKLKHAKEQGDKKAGVLLHMKQNPSNFLSTIQIGITLAGLLSGAFAAETLAAPIVQKIANAGVSGTALAFVNVLFLVLSTLVITYFMLVFGELVPKRMAMARPEQTARRVAGPINALSKITKPLVWLLSASTNGVLRLLGIDPNQTDTPVTEEEIILMAQEGHAQGNIEEDEVTFVENVFEFTDQIATNVMVHRTEIEALPVQANAQEYITMVEGSVHSRFPIYEGTLDNIVGVLHSKDVVAAYLKGMENNPKIDFNVRRLMRPAYYIPFNQNLVQLFSKMKEERIELAVVVDEYGGTAGIITIVDIVEELVGKIENEDNYVQKTENGYLFDGRTDMEEAAALMGFKGEETEMFSTLSGFVVHKLGYVPHPGQTPSIIYQGWVLTVQKGGRTYIPLIRATVEQPPK